MVRLRISKDQATLRNWSGGSASTCLPVAKGYCEKPEPKGLALGSLFPSPSEHTATSHLHNPRRVRLVFLCNKSHGLSIVQCHIPMIREEPDYPTLSPAQQIPWCLLTNRLSHLGGACATAGTPLTLLTLLIHEHPYPHESRPFPLASSWYGLLIFRLWAVWPQRRNRNLVFDELDASRRMKKEGLRARWYVGIWVYEGESVMSVNVIGYHTHQHL
jgi:hypothetical protein